VKSFNPQTKEVKYFNYEDIDSMVAEIDKSVEERIAFNRKNNIINPHDLNKLKNEYFPDFL
jgi:hypothetical protein